jgi:hypothetical protein
MDAFSYVSIVPSIIIALGMTRLLTGVGKILEKRGKIHTYWVHELWSLNVFLFMVLNWWILIRWESEQTWTFPLFLFLLLTPIVSFLLSVMLFREPLDDSTDFEKNYYDDHRWFFSLAAILGPLDFIDTALKGVPHLLAQGPFYFVTIALLTVLSVIAVLTKNKTYHKFFAVFFLIYILIFISVNLNTLITTS